MHDKTLIKKGYKSIDTCSGTTRLKNKGEKLKKEKKIKSYKVVPYNNKYELYVKK